MTRVILLPTTDVGNQYPKLSNLHHCGQRQLAFKSFEGHRKEGQMGSINRDIDHKVSLGLCVCM